MQEILHSIPPALVPTIFLFLAGFAWAIRTYDRFNNLHEKNHDLKESFGQFKKDVKEEMVTMKEDILVTMGEKMDAMKKEILATVRKENKAFTALFNLVNPSSKPNGSAAKSSPRALTKSGKKIAKELDADRLIDKHYDIFSKIIDEEKPITKLEVENIAFRMLVPFEDNVAEIFDEGDYKQISNTIYESKNIEHSIYAAQVFSILLRDRYLKNHPELQK